VKEMSFKSGVKSRWSDRWWERRRWQWWGDVWRSDKPTDDVRQALLVLRNWSNTITIQYNTKKFVTRTMSVSWQNRKRRQSLVANGRLKN